MTEEEKIELRIKFGLDMIRRAEEAKRSAQIKDYMIFVDAAHPEYVDHIHLIKE